ncbi:hypothetical protein V8C86DRAFT_2679567 [Haematococcus lacustris]
MRLLINCPSGQSRLLQVAGDATVLELKELLQDEEGIPVRQQVLCFAGLHMKDHLTLLDHKLEELTLSDEVVIYLTHKLADPKLIYLAARAQPSQLSSDLVEADMPVGEVMALLESRALAGRFSPGSAIFIKRRDGSTIPMPVDPAEGISHLQGRVAEQEGVEPTSLTFMQAQDGCMHVLVHPSAEPSGDTYPVYKRSLAPQPTMFRKEPVSCGGQPLPDLAAELCVLP